jgi:hypothetical protein
MRKSVLGSLALALVMAFAVGETANAAPIDYIFNGTATGTLNDVDFSSSFQIELVGDTTAVTTGGGESANVASAATFSVGASSGTLLGTFNEIVSNPSNLGGTIIFGQDNTDGFFGEGGTGFGTYDLTTAFPLTVGAVTQTAGSTYFTSLGDLVFTNITAISFQADLTATPLPPTWTMLLSALIGIGFFAYRSADKNKRTAVMSAA